MRTARIAILIGLTLVAGESGLEASTVVIPSDAALVAQAPVIAEVSVLSVSPSPAAGTPSTDYVVLVERLFKGRIGGTSVVVRVPGGLSPDGLALEVVGAPSFREGDRVLLFLNARRDGTYGIVHLALGAFFQLRVGVGEQSRKVATRDLLRVQAMEAEDAIDSLRDWDGFSNWLGDGPAGTASSADYFLPAGSVLPRVLRIDVDRMPVAWNRFAAGRRVRWRWPAEGAPARKILRRALDSWMGSSRSSVRLGPAAAPASGHGTKAPDGVNEVSFGDPEELLAGSFSCRSGGVAAVSAVWYDPAETFRFREGANGIAMKALEAEVVVNDGAECLLAGKSGGVIAQAIIAHEIGHTLGLEHSAEPMSVMFPVLLDREGLPELGVGELQQLEFLYPPRLPEQSLRKR